MNFLFAHAFLLAKRRNNYQETSIDLKGSFQPLPKIFAGNEIQDKLFQINGSNKGASDIPNRKITPDRPVFISQGNLKNIIKYFFFSRVDISTFDNEIKPCLNKMLLHEKNEQYNTRVSSNLMTQLFEFLIIIVDKINKNIGDVTTKKNFSIKNDFQLIYKILKAKTEIIGQVNKLHTLLNFIHEFVYTNETVNKEVIKIKIIMLITDCNQVFYLKKCFVKLIEIYLTFNFSKEELFNIVGI